MRYGESFYIPYLQIYHNELFLKKQFDTIELRKADPQIHAALPQLEEKDGWVGLLRFKGAVRSGSKEAAVNGCLRWRTFVLLVRFITFLRAATHRQSNNQI